MQKRTAFIGSILSLVTLVQPCLFKTGFILTNFLTFLIPQNQVNAHNHNSNYLKWRRSESGIKLFNKALNKIDGRDYQGAIDDFEKFIKRYGYLSNENAALAHYNIGLIYQNFLNNNSAAISEYDKSIKKDKNYLNAYLNRSIAKFELNDLEGACSDAKKSVGSGYRSEVNDWIKNNC